MKIVGNGGNEALGQHGRVLTLYRFTIDLRFQRLRATNFKRP